MADITIYTTKICPYCARAKSLLQQKGIEKWEEIDVSNNPVLRDQMLEKTGGARTVPQIFINGKHIGGADDLMALDGLGELDGLLNE